MKSQTVGRETTTKATKEELKSIGENGSMASYFISSEDAYAKYSLVENSDGSLRCSCGHKLIKEDQMTWVCEGGFPTYHLDQGDIIQDKFGNMMLKPKSHESEDKARKK